MNLEQALSLLDGDDEYAGALTTREEYRAAAFVLADEVRKLRAAQQQKPAHTHGALGITDCFICNLDNPSSVKNTDR